MLYWFNLVNVSFQKEIDAATKGKINPIVIPKTLFWFRWGAMFTWFSGFIYYFLLVNAEASTTGHAPLAFFVVGWSIAFVVLSALYRTSIAGGPLKDGRVLAIVDRGHRPLHRLRDRADGAEGGRLEPDDLDHGRRRARHDHVPQRLDDHLAAPEAHPRRDEGDRRERRAGAGRSAQVGAPCVPRLAHQRVALDPDAVLHGRRQPLPDLLDDHEVRHALDCVSRKP
jgi:hypothetical protein